MARSPKKPAGSTSGSAKPARRKKSTTKAKSTTSRRKKTAAGASTKSASATKKARKAKSPRARPRGPVTTKVRTPRNWRRLFVRELLFISFAAGCGLMVTGSFLWSRAQRDVSHYLAHPPQTHPGMVYSAPIQARAGQQATLAHVGEDLLAAGYERVTTLNGPDQFEVKDDTTITVWNPDGLDGVVPGKHSLHFTGDAISRVSPRKRATFRPVVLAAVGDTDGRRTDVEMSKLSKWMEPALLSMEDSRFREHQGVDIRGIARALVHNLMGSGGVHGGSTLTQQLAKNLFLNSERTLQRKIREAFFAASLEANLSKDELLELYLSEVYLGQAGGVPIHGVEQAARAWFGISAERLNLSQSATIAGIISAPNRYSPTRHPERATERRDMVLKRMVDEQHISAEEAQAVVTTPLKVAGVLPGATRRAPWAVDVAVDQAESKLGPGGLFSSGHRVFTSLQPLLQRSAEQAVAQGLAELDLAYPKAAGAEAALVAVRVNDGAIVAIVGGRDYASSAFNRATHGWRQAGSTVKPLTLVTAFENDNSLSPISRLVDEPISRQFNDKNWQPQNYDGEFVGDITVRQAIEASRNIPAILLAEQVGSENLYDFYRQAGLSKATQLPSASLGSFRTNAVEMAGAYTLFAGGGTIYRPQILTRIEDRREDLLADFPAKRHALASNRATALATHVLEGVMTNGTGARSAIYGVNKPAAGKTGTTDDYRDAWFVGSTPELAIAVWVGKDRGTLGLSGSRAALPIWSRFAVASGTLGAAFPRPEGLETASVCQESGMLAREACEHTYEELFREGNGPSSHAKCDHHQGPLAEITRVFSNLFGRSKKKGAEADQGEVAN
jgi:penicillin-binding protein 1B